MHLYTRQGHYSEAASEGFMYPAKLVLINECPGRGSAFESATTHAERRVVASMHQHILKSSSLSLRVAANHHALCELVMANLLRTDEDAPMRSGWSMLWNMLASF